MEAPSEWKSIKERIREQIPGIAFLNWFEATRQVERRGDALAVVVPDEPTAAYIAAEYGSMVHTAAAAAGITEVRFVLDKRREGFDLSTRRYRRLERGGFERDGRGFRGPAGTVRIPAIRRLTERHRTAAIFLTMIAD